MLGRYQVLKPLAKGGMAEVLLARAIGLKGFERHVVIKRIRVENTHDQKAIDMFLDEARLVASLHHRNIVQVHDVGEEAGKYFFVMEYVHGCDTRELLRHVKEAKQQIPLEHVITIITAAAAGLHYAHEQRGPDRKPLGIVHRDISPGNILLAYDGGVKVVDFGIAKAEIRASDTQAGEMKGKLGYMSPEQCRAQPLDRRTDIFLLGIVLWELCTVRRLFNKDSRFETMAAIVDGSLPLPSKYRKDIPQELERIIGKALAKTPEERYQTADELRLVLEAFAARHGLGLSPGRLSDYLKERFGEVPEPWLVEAPPPKPDEAEVVRRSRPSIPPPIEETSLLDAAKAELARTTAERAESAKAEVAKAEVARAEVAKAEVAPVDAPARVPLRTPPRGAPVVYPTAPSHGVRNLGIAGVVVVAVVIAVVIARSGKQLPTPAAEPVTASPAAALPAPAAAAIDNAATAVPVAGQPAAARADDAGVAEIAPAPTLTTDAAVEVAVERPDAGVAQIARPTTPAQPTPIRQRPRLTRPKAVVPPKTDAATSAPATSTPAASDPAASDPPASDTPKPDKAPDLGAPVPNP